MEFPSPISLILYEGTPQRPLSHLYPSCHTCIQACMCSPQRKHLVLFKKKATCLVHSTSVFSRGQGECWVVCLVTVDSTVVKPFSSLAVSDSRLASSPDHMLFNNIIHFSPEVLHRCPFTEN